MVVDYEDKALEKPLKLVLKVGGSEVTELSGSGHDSSYYDDRSDHERERHKEKKKKKKKKSEKDKDKYVDDEERRRRKVSLQKNILHRCARVVVKFALHFFVLQEEKRKKREREQNESEPAASAPSACVPVEPFTIPKTITIGLEVSQHKLSKNIIKK